VKVDLLVAEIGSTTTILNGFAIKDNIRFIGKGMAKTTVETDVTIGLRAALDMLETQTGSDTLTYEEMFAASSAAGGLRMTVSGLVYEMTVRAAKEAALNAGANIHLITAGELTEDDLEQIVDIRPNIVLVSGGTDYGERHVAFNNLRMIEALKLNTPILYAGNIENHYRIKKLFEESDQKPYLTIVDNVYPRVDYMNIHPVRRQIYKTFEEHIIHAKGMGAIKDMVKGSIMPTPGSVMEAAILLHEAIGNLMVIDVGGATTDIHTITSPSKEFEVYSEGEPLEKRTVEGDLGVFINYRNVIELIGKENLRRKLDVSNKTFDTLIENFNYKPETPNERKLIYELTRTCVHHALNRHIGDLRSVYTSSGQKVIPEGRDLTQVQTIILTGGALVYLENTEKIIREYIRTNPKKLVPKGEVKIYKDHDYIMSSLGVLSLKYRKEALTLLQSSLGLGGE